MAIINNDSDSMMMVTIPQAKYECLVRDAVTIEIIKDYVINETYMSSKDLRRILGLPKEEDDE